MYVTCSNLLAVFSILNTGKQHDMELSETKLDEKKPICFFKEYINVVSINYHCVNILLVIMFSFHVLKIMKYCT